MSKPLENCTVKELLEIAREKKLSGYSKMRKAELIYLIRTSIDTQHVSKKVTTPPVNMAKPLENFTVKELIEIAKEKKLSGYSKMRKSELISLISTNTGVQYVSPKVNPTDIIDKCAKKICVSSKICNPQSGLCVNRTGEIGRKIINSFLKDKISKPAWDIYSIDGCNYCKKAKDLLTSLGLQYTEIKILKEDKQNFFTAKASETGGYKSFPVIFDNGVFIGGYTELEKMLSKPTSSGSSSFHMIKPQLVQTTKFRGNPWEDFVSMLYLLHKHPKDCVAIPASLLTGSGKITKKAFDVNSFNDTSLYWSTTKNNFYIPLGLWDAVKACLKRKARFIVMPLGITGIMSTGESASHANFLIYNSETKALERFEPHGVPNSAFLNVPNFEKKLAELFNNNVDKDMIRDVYAPLSFCPAVNVQIIQAREKEIKLGEAPGFCVAWSAWYADIRMSNPKKSRSEVVNIGIEKLRKNPYSFTQFIRSYSSFLTRVGDQLKKSNNPARVFASYTRGYT